MRRTWILGGLIDQMVGLYDMLPSRVRSWVEGSLLGGLFAVVFWLVAMLSGAPAWALVLGVIVVFTCGIVLADYSRRVLRWALGRSPLGIGMQIGMYSASPEQPDHARQIHRLLDVLLISRESRRLDVRVKLTLQMPDGSEWSRPALIECPGEPRSYAEQPSRFHLPTEIALLPDGPPVRGHIDFSTPNPVDPDEVFVDVEDLRSSRRYRRKLNSDGRRALREFRERFNHQ